MTDDQDFKRLVRQRMATEGIDQAVVRSRREASRNLVFLAVDTDLRDPDLAPCRVVPDDEYGRKREARMHRLEHASAMPPPSRR